MSGKPWTEKHRCEARRCVRELAALSDVDALAVDAVDACREEITFRASVATLGADVTMVVARVRALAEGRIVRETFVRVMDEDMICGEGRTRGEAKQHALNRGYSLADVRIVRVTRIRRVVKP